MIVDSVPASSSSQTSWDLAAWAGRFRPSSTTSRRSNHASRSPMAELTAGDLMTSGVLSIAPDDTVGRARELMLGLGIHGLPVVDSQGSAIGFVSSSDLVEVWPAGEPVDTIMSKRLRSVDVEAPIVQTAERMLDERIHHLLVTRQGRPIGLLSSFDILAAVAGRPRLETR